MPKSFVNAHQKFLAHHGILRTAQAKRLGVNQNTLKQMLEEHLLTKEIRGVYRLASLPPLSNPDLIQVSIRVPSSVVFLISALAFHHLTTHIPNRVYIALPKNVLPPRLDYPPLKVYRLSDNIYSAGIENHTLDGISVRVYSREKTISDCFKFRHKIGEDLAIQALKDYLRQPHPNIPKILEYARLNRVEFIMSPYLKAAL
jgi:predicted transcriptional regulator of viral defense system